MDKVKHLTEQQLLTYANGLLEKSKSREIGGHLLQCALCRNLLPAPTPQKFFSILMGENELKEKSFENQTFVQILFSILQNVFQKPPTLVWGVGSLVIILGFSFLIWVSVSNGLSNESEVAHVFETENAELKKQEIIEQTKLPIADNSNNKLLISPIDSNSVANSKKTDSKINAQKSEVNAPIKISTSKPERKISNEKKENISSSRGSYTECGKESLVEMQFNQKEEAITFRWTKVANAVKYHLFISDDEEILIDEYETEQETFYELRKILDPAKTYKWKVVVTLENGNISAGNSQRFTVKDISQSQKKSFGNNKSGIRCSENK